MPTITLKKDGALTLKEGSSTIVPLFEAPIKKQVPHMFSKYVQTLEKEKCTGKLGETFSYHDGDHRVTFVGVGKKKDLVFGKLYKDLGNAVRTEISRHKTVYFYLEGFLEKDNRERIIEEAVILTELAAYKFDKYQTKKNPKAIKNPEVLLLLDNVTVQDKKTKENALIIAEGVKFTRDISNEPSNVATPKYLAYLMKGDSSKFKNLRIEIFDHKKIKSIGMNLVDAVGKGSENPPYFVKMTYNGDPKTKKYRALVGKGVTFDTGGVNVKPGFSGVGMKMDMSGAAVVMGVIHTIARLGLKINVIAYLPFVESMLDGRSFKQDDVFTAYNGKTVEINHTDAEGRLILADALSYASQENPIEIFDVATLTGAVMIALGSDMAGMMGTNKDAMKELSSYGQQIDELVWELPLHKPYRDLLKSDIADLTQVSQMSLTPGSIIAGLFLQEFVKEDIPWVHLDIAGVMDVNKAKGIKSPHATAFGVRLLVEYLRHKQ